MTTPSSKTRTYTRFIPSEEIGAVSQWQFDAVDLAAAQQAAVPVVDREEEAAAHRGEVERSWQDGHTAGYEQGRAEAEAEARQRMDDYLQNEGRETAQRLVNVAQALDAGLREAQQRIAQAVVEMACTLARQVLREELATDPNALQPVVREALGMLVADGSPATVRLNPVDLEVVEMPLKQEFSSFALTWLADANVPPGGCLVESAGAVVDGSLEKRWARAVAKLGADVPWQADEGSGDDDER